MSITIESIALQTVLFGILSCQCPVGEEVENALMTEFRHNGKQKDRAVIDLTPYQRIADRNPVKTPLHGFTAFCSWYQDDPQNFQIRHEEAIRFFSSGYHFEHAVAAVNPLTITDPTAHMVAHMLIPMTLTADGAGAQTTFGGKTLSWRNLFCPPGIVLKPGEQAGVHLGMVITPLSRAQAETVRAQLNAIKEMAGLIERVQDIDFSRYQTLGDYRSHIASRYKRRG
jgi:hypothetical protein